MKDRNNKGQFIKDSKHPPKRIELDLKIILKRYFKDVVSTQEIANRMGVSQKTIENRIKEAGYKLRDRRNMTQKTKDKIRETLIKKGIQPKQRYSGIIWNKGLNGIKYLGHYKDKRIWNKDKTGLQVSNKKGKTYEELYGNENSNKFKLLIKNRRSKQIFPKKDTSIEVILQNLLTQLNIKFLKHQYIKIEHGYQVDFLIPIQQGIKQKTIIEAFGTYWHKYPTSRPIDIIRCNELRKEGYRVLVFWENEIRVMELNDLKKALIQ